MKSLLALLVAFITVFPTSAFAGGCAPGEPCWETMKPKKRMAPPPAAPVDMDEPVLERKPVPATPVTMREAAPFSLLPYFAYYEYDCPTQGIGAGVKLSYQLTEDMPLAISAAGEFYDFELRYVGDKFDGTLFRLPVSLEYRAPIAEHLRLVPYVGAHLLVLSGLDGSHDTDPELGVHAGLRAEIPIHENIGLFVGTEYAVADMEASGTSVGKRNLDLDGWIYQAGAVMSF